MNNNKIDTDEYIDSFMLENRNRNLILDLKFLIPYRIVPTWLLFYVLDFFYLPNCRVESAFIRITTGAIWYFSYPIYRRFKKVDISFYFLILFLLGSSSINILIVMTGNPSSFYILGLFLTLEASKRLSNLEYRYNLCLSIFSLFPLICIQLYYLSKDWSFELFGYILMILGYLALDYLSQIGYEQFINGFKDRIYELRKQIKSQLNIEILSKSFPEEFASYISNLSKPIHMPNSIVGFVDIISSTSICEDIGEELYYDFINDFTKEMIRVSKVHDVIVSNHTGDGFFFIVNFKEIIRGTNIESNWASRSVSFMEDVQVHSETIISKWAQHFPKIDTGVKISLVKGSVKMGNIGEHFFFTGVGHAINLAARVCDISVSKGLSCTPEVWKSIEKIASGKVIKQEKFKFKNISQEVTIVTIGSSKTRTNIFCKTCKAELIIGRDSNGFEDLRCPAGHTQ